MNIYKKNKNLAISAISVAVVVGIIYLAYLDNNAFKETVILQTQEQLLEITKTTACRLEEFIDTRSKELKVIASNPIFQEEVYKKVLHSKPDYEFCPIHTLYEINKNDVDALTVLDSNGIMLHRHPFIEDRPGMDITDKPGVAYSLREHKSYVSEVFYNNLGNLAVSISEPVFYKDEFTGIVRWMIQLDTISKRFIQSISMGEKGCVQLLDSNGTILSHSKTEHIGKNIMTLRKESFPDQDWSGLETIVGKMANGEEGAVVCHSACWTEKEPKMTKKIIAYAPAHAGNRLWSVFATIDYSEIAGPINRHVKNTFGLAGFLILLFGAGGLVLYRTQKKKSKLEAEIKYLEKIAESAEALKMSEEKLAGIVNSVTDHMSMMDEEYNIIWTNDIAKKLFGTNLVGKKCYTVYHGRDKACEPCLVEKCFQDGKVHSHETKVMTADGDQMTFWCTASVAAWHKDGRPKMVIEISHDITERKRSEEIIRTERDKAQMYLDVAGVILIAIGADQKVLLINKKGCELLGYKEEDIIGKNWFDNFIPGGIRKDVKAVFGKLIAGEVDPVEYFENLVLTKDGEEKIIAWHNTYLTDKEGDIIGTFSSGADITKIKQAEEEKEKMQAQLLQSRKMEAIGVLAGGVAHDFNNLLTAIQGNAELAMRKIDEENPLWNNLKRICSTTERAANLTGQLLLFSRKQLMTPALFSINKTISDLLEMFDRLIGEDIAINTDLASDLWAIWADKSSIEQMIINLVVNARDALPKGGEIIIKTENLALDEEYCKRIVYSRPGKFIRLSIEDNGVGIDKEIIQHIFEPFFSTKDIGKGTGIGLSAVYGIVKKHEGWINVYSEPNQGSTFKIYLPAVFEETELENKITEETPLSELQGHGERILLVEDEDDVREFALNTLSENGYVVFEAANVKEALDVFEKEKGNFQMAFSDVVLPDQSGLELVDQLLSRKSDLLVLLSSGYMDEKSQWSTIRERGFKFLQKPYSLAGLLRTVKEIMKPSEDI